MTTLTTMGVTDGIKKPGSTITLVRQAYFTRRGELFLKADSNYGRPSARTSSQGRLRRNTRPSKQQAGSRLGPSPP
jgi:hypothetical protein